MEILKKNPFLNNTLNQNNLKQQGILIPRLPEQKTIFPKETIFFPISNHSPFPNMTIPININDPAVLETLQKLKKIGRNFVTLSLARNKESKPIETYKLDDIYQIGCISQIVHITIIPEGQKQIILHVLSKEKIRKKIEEDISKQQRDFFLREQLNLIKQELGLEKDERSILIKKFSDAIKKLPLEEKNRQIYMEKMKSLDTRSAEYNIVHSYLKWRSYLPCGKLNPSNIEIDKTKKILDQDYCGMEKEKEKWSGKTIGAIIALLGSLEKEKTSLGQCIVKDLEKEICRFSPSGMHDEAEIRGHRKTYVGAMLGKFSQTMTKVNLQNTVIILDEIDKISQSFQEDHSSALLEVLDKEKNHSFMDLYLDIPFDFSKTLFVSTANQLNTIPRPLLDQMEIVELSGYILEEKVKIAQQYLMPKNPQLRVTGYLGKGMKESSEITLSYAKYFLSTKIANKKYEKTVKNLKNHNIHLHLPCESTPKDSPSTGMTMSLAIVSLTLNKNIKSSIAMTGEITLSGTVLPIGELREKVIAAKLCG